jgi:LmbE family N-acetylglucosaminyl deacetylase
MLGLTLAPEAVGARRVLAIGCHPDDIEIGCGGTLLALTRAQPELEVTWVVLSAHGARADEARSSASAFLAAAGVGDVRLFEHPDAFMPHVAAAVKETFESLKELEPDLVLTHAGSDLHQDHRLASQLTWQTFRDHLILEFEIPKYDGDRGSPNVFVPLSDEIVEEKLSLMSEHHASQTTKHWFDEELFRGLLRFRGMESATRYAESFFARKLTLLAG